MSFIWRKVALGETHVNGVEHSNCIKLNEINKLISTHSEGKPKFNEVVAQWIPKEQKLIIRSGLNKPENEFGNQFFSR